MTKHVLALIHGITPEPAPEVEKQYRTFLAEIREARLPFDQIVGVSWGVPPGIPGANPPQRPDQQLTPAEAFVGSLVSEHALPKSLSGGIDWGVPVLRSAIRLVRESVVLYGLSDAIYYSAPDGERAVRDAVFGQVFDKLDAAADGDITLHIVGHSLGVTVAHDFLYALFGEHEPTWPSDAAEASDLNPHDFARQRLWRAKAQQGKLKLGTFISFASQLPLFVMRKQALVKQLSEQKKLDPKVIGIDPTRTTVQWAIFYDSDELLGFATKPLYQATEAIQDFHVNSGLEPLGAHLGYWTSDKVIRRSIDILRHNTQ